MLGTLHRGGNATEYYLTTNNNQEVPIEEGASIKVKMHDTWMRGRYEIDRNDQQALLNAGDKKFVIPDGSEIEIVFK